MREGDPKFDCPPVYHGLANTDRYVEGVGGQQLDVVPVKTGDFLGNKAIEAKGGENPDEIKNTPTDEVETPRDFVEKYLETKLLNISNAYKVKHVNQDVLGNLVNFDIKPSQYVYTFPESQLEETEKNFDAAFPTLSIDTQGLKFSSLTGQNNDNLKKNNLGFSRKIIYGGQTFEVDFLCFKDKNNDIKVDTSGGDLSN